MFPLTLAPENKMLQIQMIKGDDAIKRHLSNMGFNVDSMVHVVANNTGDLIVNVKNVRIGVSSKMANRIMVKEV